ncbi:MAG: CvpA family protein [Chloroflexi bacterium]|nr:CvpA family protein [Chloroflexota bacterium]MCH7655254.1 CvpA family protein [Chloroflexota bacterium]
MNWVDIMVLVLVLGAGFMGWRNGVIRWAFTLIGGIFGVILAGQLYKTLAPAVPFGDSDAVKQLVAFGVIFVAVMIGAWIAARIVKATLKVLLLGWVDSVAGLALGVAAGAVAATAIISVMGSLPVGRVQDAVNGSTLAEPLSENLGFVRSFLPEEFDQIQQLWDLKDSLEGRLGGLVDQAGGLLAGGSGFAIGLQGLDDFAGATIYAVFEPRPSGETLGPITTVVQDDGTAAILAAIDGEVTYDVYYYVDGNDNGTCDEADADVKRHAVAEAGAEAIGVSYIGRDIDTEGICAHLS